MRMRWMCLFGVATAWLLVAAVPAMAHGPGQGSGAMPGYGPGMMGPGMMGPGMMGPGMMGPGMMGPGMMGPGMMGPGMMGPGMMGPGMMGPGMMGPGMMGPGMMGPGMMGPGMMGPGMMGPGMMGPGMMGPGMMGPGYGPQMMGPGYGSQQGAAPGKPLDTADVEAIMKARLAWQGNPRLKLGSVTAKDDQTIVAEVVTVDDSLVARYLIDRRTGAMRFDNSL